MDREKFARKSSKSRGNPGTQSTRVWLTSTQLSLDFYTHWGKKSIFVHKFNFGQNSPKCKNFDVPKSGENSRILLFQWNRVCGQKVQFDLSVFWAREKKMNCIENPSSLRDWQEKRRWNFLSDVPISLRFFSFLVLKYSSKSQKIAKSRLFNTKILPQLSKEGILLIYEVTSLHFSRSWWWCTWQSKLPDFRNRWRWPFAQ